MIKEDNAKYSEDAHESMNVFMKEMVVDPVTSIVKNNNDRLKNSVNKKVEDLNGIIDDKHDVLDEFRENLDKSIKEGFSSLEEKNGNHKNDLEKLNSNVESFDKKFAALSTMVENLEARQGVNNTWLLGLLCLVVLLQLLLIIFL